MTFRELLKMKYPQDSETERIPGCCPSHFFCDPPSDNGECPEGYRPSQGTTYHSPNCEACWDREVPEDVLRDTIDDIYMPDPEYDTETLRKDTKEEVDRAFRNLKGIDEMHEVPCDLQFVTTKKPELGIRYQERGQVASDVRDLYMRVIKNPNIRYYRCYTDDYSYGWDPDADYYIKEAGEYWFKNPGFESETPLSPSKLGVTVGGGAAKAFLNGIYGSKNMFNTDEVTINHGDKEIHIKAPEYQVPDYSDATITIHGEDAPRILDSGNRRRFETGAVRDICEGKGRCDLLPLDVVGHALANPTFNYIAQYMREDGDYERLYDALSSCGIFHNYYTLFLEVAKHFEEGCKKYGDNNWQKGIPTHCYIDSAVRHYLKYLRGDKDEPHDRAFCWNILCCIWTCIHKPELNDYAKKEEE